jgi:hypothetical protein
VRAWTAFRVADPLPPFLSFLHPRCFLLRRLHLLPEESLSSEEELSEDEGSDDELGGLEGVLSFWRFFDGFFFPLFLLFRSEGLRNRTVFLFIRNRLILPIEREVEDEFVLEDLDGLLSSSDESGSESIRRSFWGLFGALFCFDRFPFTLSSGVVFG